MTSTPSVADELAKLGISITSEFVPQSKSRTPEVRCLNWKVTLVYKTRSILTTDYTAGVAHCPAYNKLIGPKTTIHNDGVLGFECEQGYPAFDNSLFRRPGAKRIEPKTADVVYALLSDARAIDYPRFEDWASNWGYDPDSRKAEAIYQACLQTGLALRSGLGEGVLAQLHELFEDY